MTEVQDGVTPTTVDTPSGLAQSEMSPAKGPRTTPTNATSKRLDSVATMQTSTLNVQVSEYIPSVCPLCDPGISFQNLHFVSDFPQICFAGVILCHFCLKT